MPYGMIIGTQRSVMYSTLHVTAISGKPSPKITSGSVALIRFQIHSQMHPLNHAALPVSRDFTGITKRAFVPRVRQNKTVIGCEVVTSDADATTALLERAIGNKVHQTYHDLIIAIHAMLTTMQSYHRHICRQMHDGTRIHVCLKCKG